MVNKATDQRQVKAIGKVVQHILASSSQANAPNAK